MVGISFDVPLLKFTSAGQFVIIQQATYIKTVYQQRIAIICLHTLTKHTPPLFAKSITLQFSLYLAGVRGLHISKIKDFFVNLL